MHDEDAWVDALQGPPAPETPPALPQLDAPRTTLSPKRRWFWGLPVVLAVAVGALLSVVGPAPDRPATRTRGVSDAAVPVTLQVAIDRGGQLERARSAHPGDVAWFQVQATGPVTVWVQGPDGAEVVGRGDAAGLLRGTEGYLTYRFDVPGQYTFYASSGDAFQCDPGRTCDRSTLEVR